MCISKREHSVTPSTEAACNPYHRPSSTDEAEAMTPAQGWEWCPGQGQQGVPVDEKWWKCPTCEWVGWPSRRTIITITRHQRPITTQQMLF